MGRYSFDECRNLVNLTLSEGIETIDYGAFMYCNSLLDVTIPEGVKKINNQIFDNANLRSITLPSTLPEISSRAFSYASPTVVYNNSDTVLIPGDNQLGGVAKDAAKVVNKGVATYKDGYVEENDFIFDNWGNLCAYVGKDTSVTLPLTYKGEVCDISSFTGATHVTVPEGFETLPSNAFAASEIKSVKLPNSLKVIDSSAFSSCKNLTEITIPSGVTTIKSYAFYGCEALKQINIPDSVTKISSYAFQDCTSLTDVYIGKGLTSLGSSVFSGCNKLVNLIISDENESLVIYDGLLYSKDKTKLLYCPTTVTQVSIPEEVTYISSNAFSGCTKLTSIKLPNVKTIDFDAFINCISLTKVEIGSKLRNLYSAFNGCMSLKSIDIDENNPYYCSENGIVYNKEKTNAVFFCPQTTNATIPMTVSKIDFDSLRSCQNLSLTIDGENPYFTTNDGLVYNGDTTKLLFCPSNKASVTIPEGVVTMDVAVFANNNALTDVKLPNTLETISSLAFQGCGSLKEITIPDSVETISNNAFAYSGLEKINFGNGLKYIDYGAFESCRHLSKVVLPDGLETISNHAFIVCSNLSSITIPDSVTSIGEDVFNYCDDLTIRCTPGSYAETYAKNNNIRYSDSKVEPGDINGDGIVDLKDVTTLRRYLAGGYGSTIEDAAADVNGDNAIDLKDVTTLRRFLAGGYGVELK